MTLVGVVYHSGTGNTALLAEAVARGAASVPGVQSKRFAIVGAQIRDGRWKDDALLDGLDACDAVVFGTPTYMGSPSGQFKCFADTAGERFYDRRWRNKVAGGFTVSGGPSGDKLHALMGLYVLAMQLGMIWVSAESYLGDERGLNAVGCYMGVMGTALDAPPGAADLLTGELYGRRIAEIASRFGNG